jgi:hypothetical protein
MTSHALSGAVVQEDVDLKIFGPWLVDNTIADSVTKEGKKTI